MEYFKEKDDNLFSYYNNSKRLYNNAIARLEETNSKLFNPTLQREIWEDEEYLTTRIIKLKAEIELLEFLYNNSKL